MSYERRWKVLADIVTWFRYKRKPVPESVTKDLRSAKTMIQVLKADSTHIENIQKIEEYLQNIESKLILTGQELFGEEFVEEWTRKLQEAGKEGYEEEKSAKTSRFVPGLPKGQHWVRVQVSQDISRKTVEELAERNKLSHKAQKEGYILVYGDKELVKSFVKEMGEKQHKTG
jgi:hypothetical protein